jgi:hypothetical protein
MTAPARLRILQIPAANSAGWRDRIAEACRAADWDFVEYWGGAEPPVDPARNCAIVCWDDTGATLVATDWLILSCSPDDAVSVLRRNLALSRTEALYYAAGRFALASRLAQLGARVFRDTDAELTAPGLGVIPGPVLQPAEPDDERAPELSLYETLPPVVGVTTHWPSSMFSYPGARMEDESVSKFSLLGRRRLLLNGPSISLPPGVWTAHATFAVKPRGKADLFVEWGSGVEAESFAKIFDTDGRYGLELTRRWEVAAPADFRISLMMPVLDGEFTFEGVDVTLVEKA